MKLHHVLFVLPSMVAAFQRVVPVPYKASLKSREGVFNRAEECATLRDFCDVDELEMLADSLERFQSSAKPKVQGRDQTKVYEILRSQSELKRMIDDYTPSVPPEEDIFENYLDYHW